MKIARLTSVLVRTHAIIMLAAIGVALYAILMPFIVGNVTWLSLVLILFAVSAGFKAATEDELRKQLTAFVILVFCAIILTVIT